ncbi:IucA/IucC family protein [Nocardia sp. NPDC050697]|uniref:IucA/IucC family protein n=1 Tax=Nocardia sp. NPDC050697 TaxID=3155158 RepID=UPI0033EF498A
MAVKVLAELCHERFLRPEAAAPGEYLVRSGDGRTAYTFRAELLALDSWHIDPGSLRRTRDGAALPIDAIALVIDLAPALGIAPEALPEYLEEFRNTLLIGAGRPDERRLRSAELAAADFQTIERSMTEGHPCLLANAGRLGFSADDVERYAPEQGTRFPLPWLAVRRADTDFAAMSGVGYRELVEAELGAATLARFTAVLTGRGLDPGEYYLMPVHPWQWTERIRRVYAIDLAEQRIVPVGESDDRYQPQQSIRSLFNTATPRRHYVKLALSIVNMGFTRGMSADYMRTTPLINDWVRGLISGDPYLDELGFAVLYEVAAIGYRSPELTALTEPGSEYRKLLSALWRQSPIPLAAAGEQLTTMAAMLHLDHEGTPLVRAFIERSGLPAEEWLTRYLRCYLHPIAHLLYRYELKFSPHGENLILVLDGGVPVRAVLKDIGEEVSIFGDAAGLPEAARRAVTEEPDEIRAMGLLSDVFDDFLRHLALILHADGLLPDDRFWALVAASLLDYRDQHPELADRFRRWDPFVETFPAIHLNRLQLGDNRRMVDLGNSYATLVAADHALVNPIAAYRPAEREVPVP